MKLPSVERLAAAAWATARRFPVVLTCAVVAAIAAMRAINAETALELRLVATAALGLPLLTGLTLLAERWSLPWPRHWALRGLGVAVLALYYWQWPNWGENIAGLRHFHLTATLHLLVAFIAYLGVREPNGFWHFNRTLFFRFGLGAIYTGVLFAGLSIAMFGIENLFNIDIADENYGRLFFFLGFVFQTWFVLAGVPDDFERLERRDDYPAGLRVFAQYVLLPLVAVYLIILTAYLGRVVITTTWPSGWIGLLVSALAAFGILSLLLVHPRRGQEGHAWIDTYARIFWILIIPSIVMLLLAIGQRIEQYGITERRYLLLLLGIWLGGRRGLLHGDAVARDQGDSADAGHHRGRHLRRALVRVRGGRTEPGGPGSRICCRRTESWPMAASRRPPPRSRPRTGSRSTTSCST